MDYDNFKELVSNEDVGEKNNFFSQLLEDPETSAKFVLWAIDALDRLSRVDRKHVGAKYAQMIMEKIGNKETFFKTKNFRPGVSYEKMNDEIQHLNREYVGLRKALIVLLNYHGDLTLSRQQLEGMDAYDLIAHYSPLSDSMKFGTKVQAAKWKSEEEVAAEIAAEKEKSREEMIEKHGLEQMQKWEQEELAWKNNCELLVMQYFPDNTKEEQDAIFGLRTIHIKIRANETL
jgi:hypothetical protein